MRLLVTGANGFIGSHVAALAQARGHSLLVWGGSRKRSDLSDDHHLSLDLDSPIASRRLQGVEGVIHLAGRYPQVGTIAISPLQLFQDNALLTAKLLETCVQAGVSRLILASTSHVYGFRESGTVSESSRLNGSSHYAASKIAAEAALKGWISTGRIRGASLRLFNIYGPGQPKANIFSTIAWQAQNRDAIEIEDDNPVRDFTYVRDIAEAFLLAVESDQDLPIALNIGSGVGRSVGELAEHIMRAAEFKGQLIVRNSSRPARNVNVADTQVAKSTLQWQPKYSLQHGIEETLASLPLIGT